MAETSSCPALIGDLDGPGDSARGIRLKTPLDDLGVLTGQRRHRLVISRGVAVEILPVHHPDDEPRNG